MYTIEMAGMYALSSRPRSSHQPRQRSDLEIDISNALGLMMNAIGNGDMNTYKQIVDYEFPVKLGPRIESGYRPLLQNYIHPYDKSNWTYMTPLQAAVFSGKPEMVDEVLKLGNDMEYKSDDLIHPIIRNKTARGMADAFIAKSKTPEEAAPYKEIKKILLQRGAKPKMITTITGKRLAFPENKANVNEYKRSVEMLNRMFPLQTSRKNRKSKKTRKNKTRRYA